MKVAWSNPNPNPSPSPSPNPNPNPALTPSPNPDPDQVPTGATVLKRRQLRAAGWSLVVVPYWEWNALGRENDDLATTTAAREDYMRRALSPYVFDALSEV